MKNGFSMLRTPGPLLHLTNYDLVKHEYEKKTLGQMDNTTNKGKKIRERGS